MTYAIRQVREELVTEAAITAGKREIAALEARMWKAEEEGRYTDARVISRRLIHAANICDGLQERYEQQQRELADGTLTLEDA